MSADQDPDLDPDAPGHPEPDPDLDAAGLLLTYAHPVGSPAHPLRIPVTIRRADAGPDAAADARSYGGTDPDS